VRSTSSGQVSCSGGSWPGGGAVRSPVQASVLGASRSSRCCRRGPAATDADAWADHHVHRAKGWSSKRTSGLAPLKGPSQRESKGSRSRAARLCGSFDLAEQNAPRRAASCAHRGFSFSLGVIRGALSSRLRRSSFVRRITRPRQWWSKIHQNTGIRNRGGPVAGPGPLAVPAASRFPAFARVSSATGTSADPAAAVELFFAPQGQSRHVHNRPARPGRRADGSRCGQAAQRFEASPGLRSCSAGPIHR